MKKTEGWKYHSPFKGVSYHLANREFTVIYHSSSCVCVCVCFNIPNLRNWTYHLLGHFVNSQIYIFIINFWEFNNFFYVYIIFLFKALSHVPELELNYYTHFTDRETWLRWTKGHTKVTELISCSIRIRILAFFFIVGFCFVLFLYSTIYKVYILVFEISSWKKKKVLFHKLCLGGSVRNSLLTGIYCWHTLFNMTYGSKALKDILWRKDLKSPLNTI